MTTPDRQTLAAISRLSKDRDFQLFIDWVEKSRKAAIDNVVVAPETDLAAARQHLRTVTDLKKTIITADDELKMMATLLANTAGADRQ